MHINEAFNIHSRNAAIADIGRSACSVYLVVLQDEYVNGSTSKRLGDRIKIIKAMQKLRVVDGLNNYKVVIALITNIFILGVILLLFNDALALAADRYKNVITMSCFFFMSASTHFMSKAIKAALKKQIDGVIVQINALEKEWQP